MSRPSPPPVSACPSGKAVHLPGASLVPLPHGLNSTYNKNSFSSHNWVVLFSELVRWLSTQRYLRYPGKAGELTLSSFPVLHSNKIKKLKILLSTIFDSIKKPTITSAFDLQLGSKSTSQVTEQVHTFRAAVEILENTCHCCTGDKKGSLQPRKQTAECQHEVQASTQRHQPVECQHPA